MFAMMGLMSSNTDWDVKDPWDIADKMLEARRVNDDDGIVSIKKRARKPK
jgi:hypothetical protein